MSTPINKYFSGEDTFQWFVGVVESRQDPLALGRLQVRIYGVHTASLTDIPSADLPWAVMVQGLSGKQFSTPKESDVVVGFFLDASKQIPCIWGVLPGIESNPAILGQGFHDLRSQSLIASAPKKPAGRKYNTDGSGIHIDELDVGSASVLESLRHPTKDELNKSSISGVGRYQNIANTVIQARKNNLDTNVVTAGGVQWSEPYPAYNPEYPYDNAVETESGHVFELDDTPTSERIQIAHRSGSYIEWFPTGTKVEKVTKSNYQIVMADDYLHVMGKVLITVDSDALIRVKGDVKLEVGNNLSANVAGDTNFSVGGNFNVRAKNVNLQALSDATIVSQTQHLTGSSSLDITSNKTSVGSGGDLNLKAGGDLNAQGTDLNLKADATAAMMGPTVGISGGVILDGVISVNNGGAPQPGGAGSPASGQATGLPAAIGQLQKNTGEALPEDVPVPFNINVVELDPITGQAYVHQQFLTPAANAGFQTPDSNTAAIPLENCTFDPSVHTFIASSNWTLGQAGLSLIQASEGFAKVVSPNMVTSYPDPATGGEPLTIGYGSTAAGIGMPVTIGMLISRETAANYLQTSINNTYLPTLKQAINVPLTQNMVDACLSLIYNIGPGNFLKSTLRKRINASQWCAAGDAFLVWNKANHGQTVIPGLTIRRKKERSLFLT